METKETNSNETAQGSPSEILRHTHHNRMPPSNHYIVWNLSWSFLFIGLPLFSHRTVVFFLLFIMLSWTLYICFVLLVWEIKKLGCVCFVKYVGLCRMGERKISRRCPWKKRESQFTGLQLILCLFHFLFIFLLATCRYPIVHEKLFEKLREWVGTPPPLLCSLAWFFF